MTENKVAVEQIDIDAARTSPLWSRLTDAGYQELLELLARHRTSALEASQADEEIARLQRLALDCAEGKAQVNIGEDGANFVLASGEMVHVPRRSTPTRIEAAQGGSGKLTAAPTQDDHSNAITFLEAHGGEDWSLDWLIANAMMQARITALTPPQAAESDKDGDFLTVVYMKGFSDGKGAVRAESGLLDVVEAMAKALDTADRLIERGYGLDTPAEWDLEWKAVCAARAKAGKQGEGDREG